MYISYLSSNIILSILSIESMQISTHYILALITSHVFHYSDIYSQVSFISNRASRVFQVSRSPPRPTISLSRDALWSTRKKCEERGVGGGAFSRYGNRGSGGDPSWLEINRTLSFQDTWNRRDLTVYPSIFYFAIFDGYF